MKPGQYAYFRHLATIQEEELQEQEAEMKKLIEEMDELQRQYHVLEEEYQVIQQKYQAKRQERDQIRSLLRGEDRNPPNTTFASLYQEAVKKEKSKGEPSLLDPESNLSLSFPRTILERQIKQVDVEELREQDLPFHKKR